jgi:hypothetical protein
LRLFDHIEPTVATSTIFTHPNEIRMKFHRLFATS